MKRLITVLLLVLLVSFNVFAETNPSTDLLTQINNQFFKAEQVKDFNTAVELYHYPPDYSIEERNMNKAAVKSILEYFNQSFGNILSYKVSEKIGLYIALSIDGGNVPYWTKYPKYVRNTYEVQFSNEGQGYVVIDICKINNYYEIRAVHYGLPVSRKDCQKRIQEIYSGMMDILKAFM